MAHRRPLLTAALLVAVVKLIQFAIDSQVLFYDDSGAFLLNALHYAFIPERSYFYGALISVFSVPIHSLRAIVAMQVIMGGITAWLLAFILLRFLSVRPWIAIAAALIFSFDPLQLVHERLIMTETTAMLMVALFLTAALQYSRTFSWGWLATASVLGIVLVGVRVVYVPISLACAVLLPIAAYFGTGRKRPRKMAVALIASCTFTLLLHSGYKHLTGLLAAREPAYHYRTGDFLISLMAPLVRPEDAQDPRVAEALREQNRTNLPLSDMDGRTRQMWDPNGIVTRLRSVFPGDDKAAVRAGDQVGRAALLRNPWGFIRMGAETYLEFWQALPQMPKLLAYEHGAPDYPVLNEVGAHMIQSLFGDDLLNQHKFSTPSRRFHIWGRYWNVILLLTPLLCALAAWYRPRVSQGAVILLGWTLLLFVATFWGASEVAYRYLHPFSFTAIAAAAVLADVWIPKTRPASSARHDSLTSMIPSTVALDRQD